MNESGHYGLVNAEEYINRDARATLQECLKQHTSCNRSMLNGYDTTNPPKAASFYQLYQKYGEGYGWSLFEIGEACRCGYISKQAYQEITGEIYTGKDY